jgi:hypothetical protein
VFDDLAGGVLYCPEPVSRFGMRLMGVAAIPWRVSLANEVGPASWKLW